MLKSSKKNKIVEIKIIYDLRDVFKKLKMYRTRESIYLNIVASKFSQRDKGQREYRNKFLQCSNRKKVDP